MSDQKQEFKSIEDVDAEVKKIQAQHASEEAPDAHAKSLNPNGAFCKAIQVASPVLMFVLGFLKFLKPSWVAIIQEVLTTANGVCTAPPSA